MSYSFHKYWNGNSQSSIQYLIDLRNSTNIPLWLGETGENSNQWFVECIELMKTNNIGWAWWPHKKIASISGPLSIPLLPAYQSLLNYWTNGGTPPSSSTAFAALMAQANVMKIEHCKYNKDVIDAINEKHLKLESAFTMVEEIEDNEKSINKLYLKMEDHNKDEIEKVEIKLRKFVKSVIDKIYDDRNIVVFSLEIRKKQRLKSKPLKIDFTLEGDFGEGVEAVKNLLMDLIYFNFNDKLDFIIQDSICFSGIDPRQVSTLIGIFNEIAVEKNKQYILSINKYQLDDKNQEIMDLIEDNVRLELSEDSKLWKLKKY